MRKRGKKPKASDPVIMKEDNLDEIKDKQEALRRYRYEVASEPTIPMRYGSFGGDFPYGSGGYTSGYLVQRMIEAQERERERL